MFFILLLISIKSSTKNKIYKILMIHHLLSFNVHLKLIHTKKDIHNISKISQDLDSCSSISSMAYIAIYKILMVLCTLFVHINIIPTQQKIHLI